METYVFKNHKEKTTLNTLIEVLDTLKENYGEMPVVFRDDETQDEFSYITSVLIVRDKKGQCKIKFDYV